MGHPGLGIAFPTQMLNVERSVHVCPAMLTAKKD